MRDEHLIYTALSDNKIKIVPQPYYKMLYTLTHNYMSEAIVLERNVKYFVSEKISE